MSTTNHKWKDVEGDGKWMWSLIDWKGRNEINFNDNIDGLSINHLVNDYQAGTKFLDKAP